MKFEWVLTLQLTCCLKLSYIIKGGISIYWPYLWQSVKVTFTTEPYFQTYLPGKTDATFIFIKVFESFFWSFFLNITYKTIRQLTKYMFGVYLFRNKTKCVKRKDFFKKVFYMWICASKQTYFHISFNKFRIFEHSIPNVTNEGRWWRFSE